MGKQASHSLLRMRRFVAGIVYQLGDGILKGVELRGTVVRALRFHGVSSMPQFHAIAGIVAAEPTRIVGLPLPDACGVKSFPEAFPCLWRRVEPLSSCAVTAFALKIGCVCDVQQFAIFPRHPHASPQPALGIFETLRRRRSGSRRGAGRGKQNDHQDKSGHRVRTPGARRVCREMQPRRNGALLGIAEIEGQNPETRRKGGSGGIEKIAGIAVIARNRRNRRSKTRSPGNLPELPKIAEI